MATMAGGHSRAIKAAVRRSLAAPDHLADDAVEAECIAINRALCGKDQVAAVHSDVDGDAFGFFGRRVDLIEYVDNSALLYCDDGGGVRDCRVIPGGAAAVAAAVSGPATPAAATPAAVGDGGDGGGEGEGDDDGVGEGEGEGVGAAGGQAHRFNGIRRWCTNCGRLRQGCRVCGYCRKECAAERDCGEVVLRAAGFPSGDGDGVGVGVGDGEGDDDGGDGGGAGLPAVRQGALMGLAARAGDTMADAMSGHTRRAYSGAWGRFLGWLDDNGLPSGLPADPAAVVMYLQSLADDGKAWATVAAARAAIAAGHTAAGCSGEGNPANAKSVKALMAGLGRAAPAQRQAAALLPCHIAGIRATALRPRAGRGGVESVTTAIQRGRVDIALALLLRDGGLRISEAAAVRWGDVSGEADGSGRLSVRRAKMRGAGGRQAGVSALTAEAMAALEAIRPADATPAAPVLGLSAGGIARRLKAAVEAAGYDGSGFSGHSGRVGLARLMSSNGAPDSTVARQGGWQDLRMVGRYTRAARAVEALRWLEAAA